MNKATQENIGKHIFEISGCGVAPFKLVGYWQLPSTALLEANPEAYNIQMKSAPCSVGCCRHCGMPLIHHYIIKDANGNLFAVGCECVMKTGDNGLIRDVEKTKKKVEKEARAVKTEAKKQTKKQQRLDRIKAAQDAFMSTPENQEIITFLKNKIANPDCSYFWKSLMYSFDNFGNLTQGQIGVVVKEMEKEKENQEKPETTSNFIGTVDKKIEVQATIEKIITVPSVAFFYGDRTSIDLYILKDDQGNIIIHKSKKIQSKSNGDDLREGDKINVKATVKAHSTYKEIKQTIIIRPKWMASE
jgi:hypothetical protein